MRTLSIDIETYSSNDISDGVYKYVEAEDFDILLLAYAWDDEPAVCHDLVNYPVVPFEVLDALVDPTIRKKAFNANFERTCLAKFYSHYFGGRMEHLMPAEQWDCTMVKSAMLGLPMSLDMVAEVLKLEEQKMKEGKALIRYFSVPCKPTKANGGRTRNLPTDAPEKWELFKAYCARDVEVERQVRKKLDFYEIPQQEQKLWALDQRINDRGVLLDRSFAEQAIAIDADYRARLQQEAIALTELDNPNSLAQLKAWLEEATGDTVSGLTKKDIPVLLRQHEGADTVKRVLEIRQEMAKTSVKKYAAMIGGVCEDDRVRGLLQYYGAGRTGRWAGRRVQVQNLPRNEIKDLHLAREVAAKGDGVGLDLLFGEVPNVLSQLIRTAFIAPDGKTLLVSDFSAIEAVVLAWLAGEEWRMDVFRTHGKIYEASASQMFKVPIESITKGSDLRQKGKVSELALGYQGGANALETMGALNMGLTREELPDLVSVWRDANPNIKKLWYAMDSAALRAVATGRPHEVATNGSKLYGFEPIRFYKTKGFLVMRLPSGRELFYPGARLATNRFDKEAIKFMGVDQKTYKWSLIDTYGGKLVENAVQAIARDCLAEALLRLDAAGFDIIMHVHDEVVMESDALRLEEVSRIMSMPVSWAPGLPLKAEGYATPYYRKD